MDGPTGSETCLISTIQQLPKYISPVELSRLASTSRSLREFTKDLQPVQRHAISVAGSAAHWFRSASDLRDATLAHCNILSSAEEQYVHAASQGATTPPPLRLLGCSAASAVWVQGRVLVYGGSVLGRPSSRLLAMAPMGYTQPAPPYAQLLMPEGGLHPLPREGHAALPCGGGFLVQGGELRFPALGSVALMAVAEAWLAAPPHTQAWHQHVPLGQQRLAVHCVLQAGVMGSQIAQELLQAQPPVDAAAPSSAAAGVSALPSAVLSCFRHPEALQHALLCAAEAGAALLQTLPDSLDAAEVSAAVARAEEQQSEWKVCTHAVWQWLHSSRSWRLVHTTGSPPPASQGHCCVPVQGPGWQWQRQEELGHIPSSRTKRMTSARCVSTLAAVVVGGCRWVLREHPAAPGTLGWRMHRPPMDTAYSLLVQQDANTHDVHSARWSSMAAQGTGEGACTPPPRNGAAAAAVSLGTDASSQDAVLLFGGFSGKTVLGDAWLLHCTSPGACQWGRLPSAEEGPAARTDASMVRVGSSTVALLGGMDTCSLQDVWTYRLGARQGRQHVPRRGAGGASRDHAAPPPGGGGAAAGGGAAHRPSLQLVHNTAHAEGDFRLRGFDAFAPGMVACALPAQCDEASREAAHSAVAAPMSPLIWTAFGDKVDWRGRVLDHVSSSAIVTLC